MKRIYLIALAVALLSGIFTSCSEEKLSPSDLFTPPVTKQTDFDIWLKDNYLNQYNITFMYKWVDSESDFDYNLIPADQELSKQLAVIVKHLWLEAYDEVTGNTDFMRKYVPKQLMLIGSPAYNTDQSFVLGTAEGGIKVTLYNVNSLDVTDVELMNEWYFKTMHHEFAHILHQTKVYPKQEFDVISTGKYTGPGWVNVDQADAWQLGFVSDYSTKEPQEDFVEVIANYLVKSDAWWANMLNVAGPNGSPIIQQKLKIATAWMKESWNIDLKELQTIIRRRSAELESL